MKVINLLSYCYLALYLSSYHFHPHFQYLFPNLTCLIYPQGKKPHLLQSSKNHLPFYLCSQGLHLVPPQASDKQQIEKLVEDPKGQLVSWSGTLDYKLVDAPPKKLQIRFELKNSKLWERKKRKILNHYKVMKKLDLYCY